RSLTILALHAREIGGGLGLIREDGAGERVLALARERERRVVALLVPHRGRRYGAQRLAARGSGAVPGPHLEVILQRVEQGQRAEQRARGTLLDALDARGLLEQVRPAEVAHEHEVAGGDADRRGRAGPVVDDHEA